MVTGRCVWAIATTASVPAMSPASGVRSGEAERAVGALQRMQRPQRARIVPADGVLGLDRQGGRVGLVAVTSSLGEAAGGRALREHPAHARHDRGGSEAGTPEARRARTAIAVEVTSSPSDAVTPQPPVARMRSSARTDAGGTASPRARWASMASVWSKIVVPYVPRRVAGEHHPAQVGAGDAGGIAGAERDEAERHLPGCSRRHRVALGGGLERCRASVGLGRSEGSRGPERDGRVGGLPVVAGGRIRGQPPGPESRRAGVGHGQGGGPRGRARTGRRVVRPRSSARPDGCGSAAARARTRGRRRGRRRRCPRRWATLKASDVEL